MFGIGSAEHNTANFVRNLPHLVTLISLKYLVVPSAKSRTKPGLDFRLPGLDFRLPGLGFRLPGLDFRLPGLDFRLPGLDFRLPGLGFRLPGIGSPGLQAAVSVGCLINLLP